MKPASWRKDAQNRRSRFQRASGGDDSGRGPREQDFHSAHV